MKDKKRFSEQFQDSTPLLHVSYRTLSQGKFDIGFTSAQKDGKDHHIVTRPITVSAQKFHNGSLINLLYSNGQPVRVQLDDREIIPYYSDYIEWRYVLNGHLEFEFEQDTAEFEENEICFINSSALHRESLAHSECVVINISIDRTFFNERFINNISLTPLQKFLRTNVLHHGHIEKYLKFSPDQADTRKIQKCIFQLLAEARLQEPGYLDISRGYIIRLMDILSSEYRSRLTKDETAAYYDSLFASVSGYMRENLSSISMKDLTEKFHYQSNFFNNLIKRYTGVTYSGYLILLRVERARELLVTTDIPVEEIIWLIGYHNDGFFFRQFARITGTTPAKYRKLRQNADSRKETVQEKS